MKVCITGACGYIGDAAVEWLLKNGYEVIAIDNLMYKGSYMRRHKNLKFERLDVTINQKRLVEIILEVDSVIHLAAIVGDGACAAASELTLETNEYATRSIADVCKKFNKRLVFSSTCSVFGANNNLLDETSPTNPLSLYAGTKLAAEQWVREVPSHWIFRLGTLFGISADHARVRCDLIANVLTYKALQGQTLSVFGGDQWRPLLHVRDAAELMAEAAVWDFTPGTYILSNENYTIKEVAETIVKVCGLTPSSISITDAKFEDLRNYKVCNEKATRAGFIANRSLAEGIEEMVQVVKEGRVADVWDASWHNAKFIEGMKK